MALRDRFEKWLRREIGSGAKPALRKHLEDRQYRLFSRIEYAGVCQREVYHPDKGFFRAVGRDDQEALLGILRQIWLIDSLHTTPEPEVGPAADR
ncbi:MAG: hypothetical protein ACYTEZ_19930 [Planctomycetota bacterium]|jgi:hypothetical protein